MSSRKKTVRFEYEKSGEVTSDLPTRIMVGKDTIFPTSLLMVSLTKFFHALLH